LRSESLLNCEPVSATPEVTSGKEVLIIGYELPWMPTRVLGQAVFDRGVKFLNCRVADMYLDSHLVTVFAILE